jgi:hypothetical protein
MYVHSSIDDSFIPVSPLNLTFADRIAQKSICYCCAALYSVCVCV